MVNKLRMCLSVQRLRQSIRFHVGGGAEAYIQAIHPNLIPHVVEVDIDVLGALSNLAIFYVDQFESRLIIAVQNC